MSNAIPKLPAGATEPAKVYPRPPTSPATVSAAPAPDRRHAGGPPPPTTALSPLALSSADVSYVKSLMGVTPAQRMEEILLKTGVPIPANLGPNVDVTA